jgi:hypothetical protein
MLTNTENGIDKEEFRVKAIVDRVNTTAAVWLGLTVGCAECHSHKYDPIAHHEYYGLFAFFNNAVDEFDRPFVSGKGVSNKGAPPKQESKSLINVFQRRSSLRETYLHVRGDFQQRGEQVAPGTPLVLHAFKPQGRQGQVGTRREPDRLDLAQWIVDPANSLTPRVEANRIWQHLFGQGLVRTPADFGAQGEPPTHPKLLDYLATSLRQNGWSRKKLIRHIVQSAAYRQSSNRTPELIREDPDNRLVGRQNRFRLAAEFVRDQYLATTGLLSSRVGGPSFRPPLPESLAQIGFKMKWRPDSESDQLRRGMYIFYHRNLEYPGLKTFDRPDPNVTCVRRTQSNSPLQSLTQLHDDLFVKAARTLGLQIANSANGDPQKGIRLIYFKCLSRPPSNEELQILTGLSNRLTQLYRMDPSAARRMVADKDLPDSSVVSVATWIEVARTVMNLDEFVTRE